MSAATAAAFTGSPLSPGASPSPTTLAAHADASPPVRSTTGALYLAGDPNAPIFFPPPAPTPTPPPTPTPTPSPSPTPTPTATPTPPPSPAPAPTWQQLVLSLSWDGS